MTKKKTEGRAYEDRQIIPQQFTDRRNWGVEPSGQVIGSNLGREFSYVEGGITYVLFEGKFVDIGTLDDRTAKSLRVIYGI